MPTLTFNPKSVVELAVHVVPEFYPVTLLIRSDLDCQNELAINSSVIVNVNWPDAEGKTETLEATIVFRFEGSELKEWVAVTIPAENQALIHRVRYLCRHHTNEYGKLFGQLVNDVYYSH
ncbi:hypothetical protein [Idiomarina sp. HP20-50]|uniref:hypothetical protein n=1 Tax=Idiomarina sp. HP20-50 TaxID=3070813 RepID=UPI00294B3EF6|nr:hypothetical protein [Idiomarina sp. HP20-50]MDV6315068.1 hypothetical protein [Idiomarina sp. HP20-50]